MPTDDLDGDAWTFRPDAGHRDDLDLAGYTVHATDGEIGRVDRAELSGSRGGLTVSTGPRLLGHALLLPVLVPAGVVHHIDEATRTVHVDRSGREIDGGPPFDPDDEAPAYRDSVAAYYGFARRSRQD
ncbi:hypothetical protein Kfla_3982 [Kribbella flavida DSM 17836]|uniref:PRC-barrel domain-containing protein n=1 Tax=Kribbella flavida (strain DSM 17836 / JCM 10339 / NBRC 14399) TaxID=479435 RepID=D2PR84_KRIFD|nr:hypothetical protein [Kribbella flavida]ADB33032.1 hypothetical protein Kfla_3982 [Kribbella flavida DSM 17836]